MIPNTCPDCQSLGMALCPRHGLNRATKKPKGNPLLRSSSLKPSKLKPASDKRAEEKKTWALIKKAMLRAQLLTNGYTACMNCGTQNPKPVDLHHLIPSGKGGPWTVDNAAIYCRKCHDDEHGTQPEWSKT